MLPVILILLFGFGLSLDVKNVPVAVVLEDSSPAAENLLAGFRAVTIFSARSRLLHARRPTADDDASGWDPAIPSDFARALAAGRCARCSLLVHGTDANRARIIEAYVQGAVGQWAARQAAAEGSRVGGRTGDHSEPAVVQRCQRQPLLPRPGTDRAGHDADRRIPDRDGHGAGMGARHVRGALRHAGAQRGDPARQDDPLFRPGRARAPAVRR